MGSLSTVKGKAGLYVSIKIVRLEYIIVCSISDVSVLYVGQNRRWIPYLEHRAIPVVVLITTS